MLPIVSAAAVSADTDTDAQPVSGFGVWLPASECHILARSCPVCQVIRWGRVSRGAIRRAISFFFVFLILTQEFHDSTEFWYAEND